MIGNFVSFTNATFKNNVATEFGGAVGLVLPSFHIIFDDRTYIRPMEFNDWYV